MENPFCTPNEALTQLTGTRGLYKIPPMRTCTVSYKMKMVRGMKRSRSRGMSLRLCKKQFVCSDRTANVPGQRLWPFAGTSYLF